MSLEDVVEDIVDRRGVTPLKLGGDFTDAGHRVISAKTVKDGRVQLGADVARFVDSSIYKKWMKNPLRAGDVLMTSEAPLGELAFLDSDVDWVLGQRLFAIRPRYGILDGLFLYYVLTTTQVRADLLGRATGTTVQGIRQSELRLVKVPVPPLSEQKRIAKILGSLDDRITLLRETNTTLEAIAQALFKSWFVDFDPVHAKMQGRAPEGMDEATAALFPDSFEDSELGPVPKGWKFSDVEHSFILTMGQSPPGDTYNVDANGLPFYQGRTDFGFRFPSKRIYCEAPTRLANEGDTLVSVRAPVGDVNMAIERCCIGRGVASVRHPDGYAGFTFYAMRALGERFKNFDSEGTVFGSINKKDFQALPVIQPAPIVLSAFDELTSPLDQRVVQNEEALRSLVSIRDTLLPRLISGQLRIEEAQETLT